MVGEFYYMPKSFNGDYTESTTITSSAIKKCVEPTKFDRKSTVKKQHLVTTTLRENSIFSKYDGSEHSTLSSRVWIHSNCVEYHFCSVQIQNKKQNVPHNFESVVVFVLRWGVLGKTSPDLKLSHFWVFLDILKHIPR